jgi:hypothetical protein
VGLIDKDVMAGIVLPNEKPLFTSSNFQNNDEAVAYDDLELSKQVNQQLNEVSVRGIAGKVSFVTASNSPDAYTLGGRYDIKGEDISVRVNIVHNKKIVHRFEVTGKSACIECACRNDRREKLKAGQMRTGDGTFKYLTLQATDAFSFLLPSSSSSITCFQYIFR